MAKDDETQTKKKAKHEKRKAKDEKRKAKDEKRKAKDEKKKAKDEKRKAKDEKKKAKDEKRKAKDEKKKTKDEKKKTKDPKRSPDGTKKAEKKGAMAGSRSAQDYPRIPLTLLEEVELGVESASAIAPLGRGRALVVNDDVGIFLSAPDAPPRLLRGADDASALGDLESLCASEDGKTVYAVSEERGEVFAFSVGRGADPLSKPKRLGVLARPGKGENKGWEGASYLGTAAGHGPCLLVAHEREPMAVGVFALPALREVAVISLDDTNLATLIDDVADLAVCPSSDHVFLLSDQAHRIVETRLDLEARRLEVLAIFDLDLAKKDKPEGLAFESPDRLVVVTDHASLLLRFALARR